MTRSVISQLSQTFNVDYTLMACIEPQNSPKGGLKQFIPLLLLEYKRFMDMRHLHGSILCFSSDFNGVTIYLVKIKVAGDTLSEPILMFSSGRTTVAVADSRYAGMLRCNVKSSEFLSFIRKVGTGGLRVTRA